MRTTLLRLAESVSSRPLNLRETSAALLPPTPLYRRILRAHRSLPPEMRSLGDDYVKAGELLHENANIPSLKRYYAEFRRHKEVANKVHIIGFLSQWKMYLDELPSGPDAERFSGKKLDPTVLEKMSAEQLGQLYELMNATRNVYNPNAPPDEAAGVVPPKSS